MFTFIMSVICTFPMNNFMKPEVAITLHDNRSYSYSFG